LAVTLTKERYTEVPVLLNIRNTGQKSALEMQLLIRLPIELCYQGLAETTILSPTAKISGQVMKESENFRSYLLSIDSLNPGEDISLPLNISLRSGTVAKSSSVQIPLSDRTVDVSYTIDFAYRIDVIVTQRDRPPIPRSFKIRVIDTSAGALRGLLTEFNQRKSLTIQPYSWREQFGYFVGLRKAEILNVALIEFRADDIKADESLPINRFSMKGSISFYEGIEMREGLLIPSLGTYPS
jgi:hypothetical protein